MKRLSDDLLDEIERYSPVLQPLKDGEITVTMFARKYEVSDQTARRRVAAAVARGALEIEDGDLRGVHPFTRTVDTRTKETL